MPNKRICIIGAGPCGLSMLNALRTSELAGEQIPEVVCFEKQSDVAGLWNYTWRIGLDEHGEPVHNSMYRYLWSNGPKECLELGDYTFQEHFKKPIPSFPPRGVLRDYFMGRVKKNGTLERFDIRTSTVVRNVEEVEGGFEVTSFNLKSRTTLKMHFDYLVVATGHYSYPNMPTYPGLTGFPGRVLHAHDFRDAREFKDQTVLLVGSSYSAEDIAMQCLKYGAKKIVCCYRSGPMGFHWPEQIEELPLLTTIEDKTVNFKDGSKRDVDAIIFCTGYQMKFDFLPDSLRLHCRNVLYPPGLYKGIFWNENPKCLFLGMQDQYYTYTMFDIEAWVARDHILGKFDLPEKSVREEDINMWVKKNKQCNGWKDEIDFQTDFLKDLMKYTNYPEHDIDMIQQHFYTWEGHKHDNILTYREKCFTSPITGHMAPPHHTQWFQALDDTIEEFMRTEDTDTKQEDLKAAKLAKINQIKPAVNAPVIMNGH